jgi:cell division protein ZapE
LSGPLEAYQARVREGGLRPNAAQARAAERLQHLYDELRTPSNGGASAGRLSLFRRPTVAPTPRGVYMHGPVGAGKSMLMQIFYDSEPVEKRRRVHFHNFMTFVQDALHRLRKDGGVRDPLATLAAEVVAETKLLCFDEFQVENIADAMILGVLFTALFEAGVVMVATSNVSPGDLYKGGLQRERFLPFIGLLMNHVDVLELDAGVDFRRLALKGMSVYHTPGSAHAPLAEAFARLTGGDPGAAQTLVVKGRDVVAPRAALGVAWFSFDDLCARALGAEDYGAIAARFHTVIVEGIPRLDAERRDEAKRFLNLIDTLYEHKVTLIASADAAPDALYTEGVGAQAFRRCASRLIEMQGEAYLAAAHVP